ncbi:MFS transporter [Limobrevibacterium gyesilva]|uniref:MFS transporter n=1 Tax=Limobrevibacterium gyesilva TaxID=2991712 RepID=A0AA41YKI4_9PROT|nr:MFS transporter [Limobrevibacterium gyesilva]MCW3475446.1 MFS transporter [Limobrevibacterium gyesilva]
MTLPPGFRRLAWSNLSAQAAEQVSLAAAPLLAVLLLGAGAAGTGLLSAAQTLPFLLLSLPAGLLADRMQRRRLMVIAELVRAAALALLPVLIFADMLSLPLLALIGAATATGTVVFSVAAPALVPALVPRAQLTIANTHLELARSLAFAAGPPLAGTLVAFAGGSAAFILAAALSAAAALLLARLPESPRAPAPPRRIRAELAEGWRFVARHDLLRPIMATAVGWNLSWFVLQAAFVPFAVTRLGLSATGIGLIMGAYGVGMVAGAALAPWLGARVRFGTLIASGPAASVAAAAAMAASTALPFAILPMLGFFLFGVGPILWTIGQTTLRQAVTPPHMLGRVSALVMMATAGARPIGAALGGLVGEMIGLEAAILLAAAGFVAQWLVIVASPVPRLHALPEPAG